MYYHVWFKTKRRKWLLLEDVEETVRRAIADVARKHDIRLHEFATMVDHVHLLVEATDEADLSRAMHLLKGTSARHLMKAIPDIRLDAGVDHFWQKRYGARPVEPSALAGVRNYIRTQKKRPEKYER